MAAIGGTTATTDRRAVTAGAHGGLLAALRWFALVALLVAGGLLLAARAGDAYTHVSGLLFAGFGFLLGGRVLHRLLP